MKIIGLRIEKYVGKVLKDINQTYNWDSVEEILERHIICGVMDNSTLVEITLDHEHTCCGSGYCEATYGLINIKNVKRFNTFSHIPKHKLHIDEKFIKYVQEKEKENNNVCFSNYSINNEVFSYCGNGGCCYYPSGWSVANLTNFIKTKRHHDNRPVWIFEGDSNLGKTFLSTKITNLSVYETDCNDELPDRISESIIVLGNKYKFELDDIKKRIFGEHDLIEVNFK